MVRPNFIPRTLRGVGGVRLFDIPGVVYPREVLIAKVGLNHKNGKPYKEAPTHWGICTSEVAAILGITASAARSWLHRHKVPFRIVGEEGQPLRLFWRKERVLKLAQERPPVLRKRSVSLLTSAEAQRILGIGRSSLYRYELRGQLSVTKVRHPSSHGMRPCCFYRREEVERLAEYLNSMREKEEELRIFRLKHRPPHVISAPPDSLTPARTATSRKSKPNKKFK